MTGETSSGTATIEVTAEEKKIFWQFKSILPDVVLLLEYDVFNFKNGRAILHRDADGRLRKIEIEITKYRS